MARLIDRAHGATPRFDFKCTTPEISTLFRQVDMIPEILDKARELLRSGQFPRAERACRQILEQEPAHAQAWFLLGLVSYQAGRIDDAVRAYRQAIRHRPDYPEAHNNLGISLARQNKLAEAVNAFRHALNCRPNYAEAQNNLGNALRDQGKFDEAIEHYAAVVRLSPRDAQAQNNLGIVHARLRRWNEAAEYYRAAVGLRPEFAEAHNNLGVALANTKQHVEAIACFERSLRLKPAYADGHGNLGLAFSEQDRWSEAISAFRQAVKLAPRSHQWQNCLGRALAHENELSEAAECFRQAIAINSQVAETHANLASVLERLGDLRGASESLQHAIRLDRSSPDLHNRLGLILSALRRFSKALHQFDQAIALRADYAEAHVNRALAHLVTGEFDAGWAEHEWRLQLEPLKSRTFNAPRWEGQSLAGKRILLHAEQHLGDTLQFVRYARVLKQREAKVYLQVPACLTQLLQGCSYVDALFAEGDELPAFDFHLPLLSLPKVLGTTVATIPTGGPYLQADPERVKHWRSELPYAQAFKIGIHWQGGSDQAGNRGRSIPLAHFIPIAALPNVRLFSLQKEADSEELRQAPFSMTDFGSRLDQAAGTLIDTAAILPNLDLVITADSAIAHLAGALGVPVWVALPYAPDWRWLLNREDSPWYPSMRLFRQPEFDDWEPVFERMASLLQGRLAALADDAAEVQPLGSQPATAALLNSAGVRLAERGRLDEAIASFRQALQLRPDFAEAHNNFGNALQNQGQLVEAARHLREAVRLHDNYPEAHNNLGIVLSKQRKFDEAEKAFTRALELRPDYTLALNNRGLALLSSRRSAEAEACFRRVLELQPDLASAHGNLGRVLIDQGKLDDAVARFREALRLQPDSAEALNELGNALREQKKLDESAECLQKAVQVRPQFADAHNNLGITLGRQGKHDEAIKCFEQSLRLRPNYAAAHNNLGITLANLSKRSEAIRSYRQALRLKPDYAEAHNNLAIVLTHEGHFDEALAEYRQALHYRPNYPEAHSNLGIALTQTGQPQEALEQFGRALELRSDYPDAHMNRALTYLLMGDFERGWPDYEFRWQCKEFKPRNFKQPRWQGEPLDGRRVLLHTEQGLGDTLQFIRYARLVKERGGTVLVRAGKSLLRLLRLCPYIDGVFMEGGELPDFDAQLPLLSLPYVFGTRPETIPGDVPYLFADPHLIARWRDELAYIDAFKVGINWQGNPKYRGDQRRSIPLAHYAALAAVPGVRLISLQHGFGTEQLEEARFSVTELGNQVDVASGPFMDTAAVMKNLDLFVTSDTALAHLAGGLGVPVWLALPYAPDWRWLLEREDTPWYPTMRLFRQPDFDTWEPVFERMADALRDLVAGTGRREFFKVPMRAGELLDRLTTLRLKVLRGQTVAAAELGPLEEVLGKLSNIPQIDRHLGELEAVNDELTKTRAQLRDRCVQDTQSATAIDLAEALVQGEVQRRRLIDDIDRMFASHA